LTPDTADWFRSECLHLQYASYISPYNGQESPVYDEPIYIPDQAQSFLINSTMNVEGDRFQLQVSFVAIAADVAANTMETPSKLLRYRSCKRCTSCISQSRDCDNTGVR
jgi:hypothetical protein